MIFQKVILPNNGASIKAYSQPAKNYVSFLNDMNEELIKTDVDHYLMHRIEFYLTLFTEVRQNVQLMLIAYILL